jgi:hypothetical protein
MWKYYRTWLCDPSNSVLDDRLDCLISHRGALVAQDCSVIIIPGREFIAQDCSIIVARGRTLVPHHCSVIVVRGSTLIA